MAKGNCLEWIMVSHFTSRLYFHKPKVSGGMTHHIPQMKSVINDLFYI